MKILLLFIVISITFFSSSQDSLFIRNEIESRKKITKSFEIDSMFISLGGDKIKLFKQDTTYRLLSNINDESSFYDVKSFSYVLNGVKINDTMDYLFDLHLDNKHFKIYLPGKYILKGSSSESNLFINTYKAKKKLKFWKRKFYGYTFGTYIAVSGQMYPSRKKTETKE